MLTIGEKVKKIEDKFGVVIPDNVDFEEWVDTLENMEAGREKKLQELAKKKEFKIYMYEGALDLSDDEIRNHHKEYVRVLYGSNDYKCNLTHINELKECVLKNYPNTKDEDIEVLFISTTESIRHARFTMLSVPIPTEDFIKLRSEGQIYIL